VTNIGGSRRVIGYDPRALRGRGGASLGGGRQARLGRRPVVREPFSRPLVRLYCEEHANLAGTMIESEEGFELSSMTSVEPVPFASDAERLHATGGHRQAESVVGWVSQFYDEEPHVRALGCRACGPLPIEGSLKTHVRRLAEEAKLIGRANKWVLRARRSC
jgi:hypothetical protein